MFASDLLARCPSRIAAALLAAGLWLTPDAAAEATELARLPPGAEVDVMLVLAVDASQSMDESEQRVQRNGYVEALTSREVLDAIAMGPNGKIAVAYFEWGSSDNQSLIAPWQIIDGAKTAENFANRIAAAPLQNLEKTSITSALTYADRLFAAADIEAGRKVIDISGDGPNNDGPAATHIRDALVDKGVTINGLPILMGRTEDSVWNQPALDIYYQDCVIGGAGAFLVPVEGMENFSKALKMKLILEIAGLVVPAPANGGIIPAAGKAPTDCRSVP